LKCCDKEDATKTQHKIPVPSLVMFMPHDERFALYEGDVDDYHAVNKWVAARRTPMIMTFTQETAEALASSAEKQSVLFLVGGDDTRPAPLENSMREAAKQFRGKVIVCFSGTQNHVEKRLIELAGIDEESLPVITLLQMGHGGENRGVGEKYRLPVTKETDTDAIVKFVTDYEAGKLKPFVKSEPIPVEEEGPVYTLVGSEFKETINDKDHDVVVDFYAPWCGHCHQFAPIYKEFASKLKHVKSIKIMKMDATRNDMGDMNINGFPAVIVFPAGENKEPSMYQGNRKAPDMIQWLHRHATIKFDDKAPATPAPAKEDADEASGLLDEGEEEADL